MGVLAILIGSGAALLLAGRYYAPLIGRVMGEQLDRPTPAVRINDGRDYVPTRTPIVFAHHYASIAGAGPIVGPILAIYYGWGPALLWILLGGIFLGAVHDYAATHIALREGGKNLAVITRRYVGPTAFLLMLAMLVALLVLVCAAFLDLSARALTSTVPLAVLGVSDSANSPFRVEDGKAVIGGIASTSVIVITAFSPLIGWFYLKRKASVWLCSLLALAICALSIGVGLHWPVSVSPLTWKLLIGGYVLISAGLPVWLFLQSRDFINVHILYAGMLLLFVAVLMAAVRGGGAFGAGEAIPLSNWTTASTALGPGWPVLFVTIACGAVSGFHSLCGSGTTCKQLRREIGARQVGYYAMLLESFLAVIVVCCVLIGLSTTQYVEYRDPGGAAGNAVLTFAMSVGLTAQAGLDLPVALGALGAMLLLEGFLVTTLDTAIRLTRYMIEEAWATVFARYDVFADAAERQARAAADDADVGELIGTGGLQAAPGGEERLAPTRTVATHGVARFALRTLQHYWVNSGIAVALMLAVALTNGYGAVWRVFGSANQLLAALALLIASCWLAAKARPVWYALAPAGFMLVTSVAMLVRELALTYIPGGMARLPLTIAALVVLSMTAGLVFLAARRWLLRRPADRPAQA